MFVMILFQGTNLSEKWVDICQKLTSIYWPNYGPHRWQGASYAPEHAKNVAARLREVHSLRTLHKQLTQLLSHSEQDELRTNDSFEPFNNMNAVQYNPYTGSWWSRERGVVVPLDYYFISF